MMGFDALGSKCRTGPFSQLHDLIHLAHQISCYGKDSADSTSKTVKPSENEKRNCQSKKTRVVIGELRLEEKMAATTEGKLVYRIYRALSYSVSPVVKLHLQYRRLRGREHPHRWTERLGRPSLPRPPGPLLWFHAVSLGAHVRFFCYFNFLSSGMKHYNVCLINWSSNSVNMFRYNFWKFQVKEWRRFL